MRSSSRLLVTLGFAWGAMIAGCFSADGDDACTPGNEACMCADGMSCLGGLECRSGVCVFPGSTDGGSTTGSSVTAGSVTASSTGSTGSTSTTSTSSSSSGGTTAGSSTSGGSSGGAVCGNGILDQPTEMCDGGPGCDPNCNFEDYACNPLNDAGCAMGSKCAFTNTGESFACHADVGTAGLGEACIEDWDCTFGYTCLFNVNADICPPMGNCCVEYCDTGLGAGQCADPTATCLPFFPMPMYQGLEELGYCGN